MISLPLKSASFNTPFIQTQRWRKAFEWSRSIYRRLRVVVIRKLTVSGIDSWVFDVRKTGIMDKTLVPDTAELLGGDSWHDEIEMPFKALIEAQRLWMDCAHDVLHAEMDMLSPVAGGMSSIASNTQSTDSRHSRLRMHMMLARAQYERSLNRFRTIADDLDRRHGSTSQRWCSEMLAILEPKPSWPSPSTEFKRMGEIL